MPGTIWFARVDVHDDRAPRARLGLVGRLGEGRDDDHVAGPREVRGRAVHADDARARLTLERVRLEPAAVRAVPDVNLLVRQDVGRAHERRRRS